MAGLAGVFILTGMGIGELMVIVQDTGMAMHMDTGTEHTGDTGQDTMPAGIMAAGMFIITGTQVSGIPETGEIPITGIILIRKPVRQPGPTTCTRIKKAMFISAIKAGIIRTNLTGQRHNKNRQRSNSRESSHSITKSSNWTGQHKTGTGVHKITTEPNNTGAAEVADLPVEAGAVVAVEDDPVLKLDIRLNVGLSQDYD
jgi:hypothetical protein